MSHSGSGAALGTGAGVGERGVQAAARLVRSAPGAPDLDLRGERSRGSWGSGGRVGRRWGVRVSPGGWIREEGVAGWPGHCGLLGRLVQLGHGVGVYPFDFFCFLFFFLFLFFCSVLVL